MKFLLIFLTFFLNSLAENGGRKYGQSTYEPVAVDSRIKTFIYSENEIYNLKFHIDYNSFIELSKDEAIETIALGNPYPWKITPLDRRLFIKPIEVGAKTNMTIITNKRTYYFFIESHITDNTSKSDPDILFLARFYHPTEDPNIIENAKLVPSKRKIQDIEDEKASTNSLDGINILYSFPGKSNISTPIEVFDDGKQTYLRFKKNVNYDKVSLFSIKGSGKNKLKFKKTGDFIVLNSIFQSILIEYNGAKTEIYNDILEL